MVCNGGETTGGSLMCWGNCHWDNPTVHSYTYTALQTESSLLFLWKRSWRNSARLGERSGPATSSQHPMWIIFGMTLNSTLLSSPSFWTTAYSSLASLHAKPSIFFTAILLISYFITSKNIHRHTQLINLIP